MRSANHALMSGTSTTLAAPMPASARTVDATSAAGVGESARSTRESAERPRAAVAVRSSPYLLVTTGARKPKTANVAAGTVPSRPARASPNPRSDPMISSSGVMPVTAVRRFSAVRAIASPAHRARRPRVAGPDPPGVGAVAAGMVNTCSEVATNDGIMG